MSYQPLPLLIQGQTIKEGVSISSTEKAQMYSGMTQIPQSLQNGKGCIKVVSGSGFRYLVPFPYKLHQMLEETAQKGDQYTDIVTWLPDGLHFKVLDSNAFMQHVVPLYFKQKSYKSFLRQLHIYGFKRVLKGDLQGAFHHPKFIKGKRELTHEIDRIKAPVARKNARPSMQTGESSKQEARETETRSSPATTPRKNPPDTLEWLVSSGMTFSDLEPSRVPDQGVLVVRQCGQEEEEISSSFSSTLLSHADQISSLFSPSMMQEEEEEEALHKSTSSSSMAGNDQRELLFPPSKPSALSPVSPSLLPSSFNHNNDDSTLKYHHQSLLPNSNMMMMMGDMSSFMIACPPPSGNQEAVFK